MPCRSDEVIPGGLCGIPAAPAGTHVTAERDGPRSASPNIFRRSGSASQRALDRGRMERDVSTTSARRVHSRRAQ